jgi:tetratricopeptide (TPR) repeat protein
MSYIKKRVPRKPGMTPQEIIADQRTLANWFTENLNYILYASGAVLVVLVITLGIVWMKGEKRASANSALSQAMAVYQTTVAELPDGSEEDTENLEKALESLTKAASEFPGSPQGHTASLFKANVLFRLGRYQEAAATIEELDTRDHELVKEINAFYLLARCYEGMEDFKKAIDSYQAAKGAAKGDMRAVIDIDLARCYELSGDTDSAISIYREVVSGYPETVFATRAGKKLATLGILDQETL